MQFKSISQRISLLFGSLAAFICLGLGLIAYNNSSKALTESNDQALIELAQANAQVIAQAMRVQINALEAVAENQWLKSDDLTLDEKLELLKAEELRSGHINMYIGDTQGNAKFTTGQTVNVADRDYYQKALAGESVISDPLFNRADNSLVMVVAVPIKDGNKVKGVLVATRDGNVLSNFVTQMSTTSREICMINKKGITIAHKDQSLVTEMYNAQEAAKENPELGELAAL